MRRIVCFLLTAAVLAVALSGCDQSDRFSAVQQAVENTNAQKRYKADFMAEFTFADEAATLLFMQGSYAIDREKQLLHSSYANSYFGVPSQVTEMYTDGYVYTEMEGNKNKYKKKADELFCYLQYAEALNFIYSDIKDFSEDENSKGTLYKFTVESGYDEQLLKLMGEGIYDLAKIERPQKEKTRFGEIECEYTVTKNDSGESMLASCQTVFTMYLYNTPPYSPGYTPPEEDYMLELKVRLKVSYTEFGNSVAIQAPDVNEYKILK